jgi:Na+/proline symporter
MPAGARGLLIAGILAAAMSTISSSINALASSVTYDFYAGTRDRPDPRKLLRIGKVVTLVWGIALTGGALLLALLVTRMDTPVVVFALSIASITYGALLGTYILAAKWPRAQGQDIVVAVAITVVIMLVVVFARPLAAQGIAPWLAPVGRLAWPWYVPLGTALTMGVGMLSSLLRPRIAA